MNSNHDQNQRQLLFCFLSILILKCWIKTTRNAKNRAFYVVRLNYIFHELLKVHFKQDFVSSQKSSIACDIKDMLHKDWEYFALKMLSFIANALWSLQDDLQCHSNTISIPWTEYEFDLSNAERLLFRFVIHLILKCSKTEEKLWTIAKNWFL